MNKKNISLIINCNKENIKDIDINKFNNNYSKIYFNINNNLENIINKLDTDYYDICDYNDNKYLIIYSSFINYGELICDQLKMCKYLIIYNKINNNYNCNDLNKYIDIIENNKILCMYINDYIILNHNLIYYFPIEYINFNSLKHIYKTIQTFKLPSLSIGNINNINININKINDIGIHILIHNINYYLVNILDYIKEHFTNYIYVYDIKSYDGIDYNLLCKYYNCKYIFIEDKDNILNEISNNKFEKIKNHILIDLINNNYSLNDINNIINENIN